MAPEVVKLTERASGWLESEVEEYLARCIAECDARRVPPLRENSPEHALNTVQPLPARKR
jgi:hypothetical protein